MSSGDQRSSPQQPVGDHVLLTAEIARVEGHADVVIRSPPA
jgi:hypothetical protein